jgi:hypothetical protein
MPAIIIGDVHGCLDELLALVRRCGGAATGAGRARIALVGDLVAKGPDSAGVIQWARESGASSVLGNHDDKVLCLRPGAPDRPREPRPVHGDVAKALRAADWRWLAALPLWLRVGRRHLVVHAGLVPGVRLEDQKREHLLNLRSITADGRPSKELDGRPWASLWPGPDQIVFGHDAVRGLQRHPFATGLDTGCVYGGALTALLLPKGELVSVPARRAYAKLK